MCKVQPYLCVNLLSIICGYNPDNIDPDRLPIYLNYTPSGTSVKNMAKWAQVGDTLVHACAAGQQPQGATMTLQLSVPLRAVLSSSAAVMPGCSLVRP